MPDVMKNSPGGEQTAKAPAKRRYAAATAKGHGGPGGRMMVEKPKNLKGSLRRLLGYLADKKGVLVLVAIVSAIAAVTTIVATKLSGTIIDQCVETRDLSRLGSLCLLILAIYLIGVAASFLQQRAMIGVAQTTANRLRVELYDSLSRLPLSYYDSHNSGDLMSRLTNDIDTISMTISQNVASLISGVISVVGILAAMLITNVWLTLVALVAMPLMLVITRSVAKVTRRYFKEQQAALGDLNGYVEEMVSGQKVVKLFSMEDELKQNFGQYNQTLRKAGTRAQSLSGIMGPLMNLLSNINYLLVAVVGASLVVGGSGLTVGRVYSFLQYMRQFANPLNTLANMFNTVQSALAAAERVFDVIDQPREADAPDAQPAGALTGKVDINDVSFSYIPGKTVLQSADIHAEAGEQIAIVGPTGAGKTTIISLLMRFYDVDEGTVCFDGTDVRALTRQSLRRNIGMVLQDTYLFSISVRDNIRYGRPDATDEEVIAAAKTANAHSFIMQLPDGYDTVIADNGGNLSQGQRQLLAIARAVLTDPRILILDEATSSIDTRTELIIQNAMLQLMKGRTSFIIAHRLSTIRNADKIIVIDGGRVVESGTHDELLQRPDGFYAALYNSQFKTGLAI